MKQERERNRMSGSEHLSRFNPCTAAAGLTPEALERAMIRGRRERAQMAALLARAALRGLRRAGAALLASIQRAQRARAGRALAGLDRHLLADIGIEPQALPGLARDSLSRPEQSARHGRLEALPGGRRPDHRLAA